MKKILCLLLLPALLLAAIPGRFMEYPDIRNDLITFSYEGDLWRVSSRGGLATRLTVHPGTETAGRISPDGAWISFSGDYDGGRYLYVIPSDGGVPKRLTWHHSAQPLTWTPDGKKIVYRTSYENTFRPITKLYAVSTEGEWPEQLPVPQGVLASFSPDGKKLAYCPKGREEYYWKRYKGGQYVDLWLYDFTTKEYTDLTDYVGKSAYPMWVGDKLYFVSDRGRDGISNLYTFDLAGKAVNQITFFNDFDVQMAASDGHQIVYVRSGYLYVLDSKSNTSRKVDIKSPATAGSWLTAPSIPRSTSRAWPSPLTAKASPLKLAATPLSSPPTTKRKPSISPVPLARASAMPSSLRTASGSPFSPTRAGNTPSI
ncbi:hypothetical protein GX408_17405 [bacterium]|nr:hypothetical protein [bacterium]